MGSMTEQTVQTLSNLNDEILDAFRDMKTVLKQLFSPLLQTIGSEKIECLDFLKSSQMTITLLCVAIIVSFFLAFKFFYRKDEKDYSSPIFAISTLSFVVCWMLVLAQAIVSKELTFNDTSLSQNLFRVIVSLSLIICGYFSLRILFLLVNEILAKAGIFISFGFVYTSVFLFAPSLSIFGLILSICIIMMGSSTLFFFRNLVEEFCVALRAIICFVMKELIWILSFLFLSSSVLSIMFVLLRTALFGKNENMVYSLTSLKTNSLITNLMFILLLSWSYQLIRNLNRFFVINMLETKLQGKDMSVLNFLDLTIRIIPKAIALSSISGFLDCLSAFLFILQNVFPCSLLFISATDFVSMMSTYFDITNQQLLDHPTGTKVDSNSKSYYSFQFLDFITIGLRIVPVVLLSFLYYELDINVPTGLFNYEFIIFIMILILIELINLFPTINSLLKKHSEVTAEVAFESVLDYYEDAIERLLGLKIFNLFKDS